MVHLILQSTAASGHPPNYRTPTASGADVISSGCSTADPMFDQGGATWLARQTFETETGYVLDKSTIPGSSMHFRSQNSTLPAQPDPWVSMDGYDALVMADNPGMDSWAYTPGLALSWAQKAWAEDAEFIIWNPQALGRLQSGFEDDATIEAYHLLQIERHEAWQDETNAQLPPGQRMTRLIPGCNVYLDMFRDQVNDEAPTATWFDDLYEDGIHMNDTGSYITSMCVAACLWGIDPFEMPNGLSTLNSGNPFPDAAYIKGKVSSVIKAYWRAGVDTSGWV